ncbi:hypothetical protein [Parendozoicomonas haliclonae]|uniref:Bacterial Pleckstrin homology domain-containing protein n=1 Tax=Parendozoicomonas haliclonae TaxID=1960125 RepID=A0A1X7AK60_9GAMM|nr:hypothetical protein [Parendozoicomonas haliclonae]SMA46994.1 hypothetical protein EHSB41UT_02272 [Parendozoicomonas haliclonae]
MAYKHTQIGVAMLVIFGLVIAIITPTALSDAATPLFWFAFAICFGAMFLFASLSIEVSSDTINWFFGPRFWKKSISLADITAAKKVRTKWYYGLGIRLTSTGWLYNVSGLTAVELSLKDGTTVMLGTNDADNLLSALNGRIAV